MALRDYLTTTRVTDKPTASGGISRFLTPERPKVDLTTLEGLKVKAEEVGFGERAEELLATKGEKPKEIFSGGFITDVFDVLNSAQYGVTGLLKGKSFLEGVKTRQSFTDQDALGDKGLPGVIAGIALDIAVDPLTYIAPVTIFKKISGAAKVAEATTKAFFSTRVGQSVGSKLIYRFGQDPVYKTLDERRIKNIGVGISNLLEIIRPVTKLDSATQVAIANARKAGKLEDLPKDLLDKAKPAFDELDKLGKEAVEVGLLKAETYQENVGKYIATLYRKFEVPEKGVVRIPAGAEKKPLRVDLSRFKKKKDIPEDVKEAMGEILEAGYPTAKAFVQLKSAIENTKFFNEVATKFGRDVAEEGFEKLPSARGLFTTSQGKIIQSYSKIKDLNKGLKPLLNQLKSTFKGDRIALSEIFETEKRIERLSQIRKEEFFNFFSEGRAITRTFPKKQIIKGVGKLPERLSLIGKEVEKFKTFNDLMKSEVGIRLEKIYQEGILERAGFKDAIFTKGGKEIQVTGLKQFYNFIKKPFRIKPEKTKEVIAVENLDKLINAQKGIENLSEKALRLKEIEKRSIDDSFRFLEETINNIRFEKEGIIENVNALRLQNLAGKYVPKPIADSINEVIRIKSPAEKVLSNYIVTPFKFGKVVLNPGTHGRNVIANFLLNDFEGLSPARLDIYAKAAKQIATKGDLYQEAKAVGLGIDTYASNELKQLLLGPEVSILGKAKNFTKAALNKASDLYQKEEEWAKMAQYIFQREKGLSSEDALKIAERATFNYAQVTPFIRRIREAVWGYPFITFTYKVTPQVAKILATKPGKISRIGKIKQAIENQADLPELERERASEPNWIRDNFYVKLPVKDKHGRSMYFDLTYIIPFGDMVSGEFLTRQIKRETGLRETVGEAILSKLPLLQTIKEIGRNQDFRGDKIVRDGDSPEKQGADLFRHLTKIMLPPLAGEQIWGGITKTGERRPGKISGILQQEKRAAEGKEVFGRTGMSELLRNVGLKADPVDLELQEQFMDREKREALETLLKEYGEIKEFSRPFIPKEERIPTTGGIRRFQ